MNQCFPEIRRQRWAYRKVLQPPWTCRPGMRAHAARDGIRVFDWSWSFLRICRIRFDFPGPRDMGERNRKPVYRDSWLPVCQSCIPAGIFAIYMTDGKRILPWSFLISFSIHLYCISTPFLQPPIKNFVLHKPLFFTTSLEIFVNKWPMHSSSAISTTAN